MKRFLPLSLGLLASAFLLYRKTARLWWSYDSPWLLHVAVGRRWIEGFTEADTRQNLFTPVLYATYEAGLGLFGIEPRAWFLVQVSLIAAISVALFAGMRLYVTNAAAAAGALLFLLGPPIASAAPTLHLIHYFEAIFFGAVATILYIAGVRRERIGFSIASALCYTIAMCAKEIAVPLPALLLVLPDGRWTTRIRHLAAPAIALAAYAAWRTFVIDLPLTGYGWALTAESAVTFPWRLLLEAAGTSLAAGLMTVALMGAGAAPACLTRRGALAAAVGLLCAVGPVIPVAVEMHDRFALGFWVWLSCAFAIGVARWKRPAIVMVATVAFALVANRQHWTAEFTRTKRMADECFVWTYERGDVLLRNPASPPGTMPELEWLKEEYLGHAKGARWFYDDVFLCLRPISGRRILEFNPRSRRVEEVQVDAQRLCNSIRHDVPLTAAFDYRHGVMKWRFGPYQSGVWRLILDDGEIAWDVPRESAYRLGTTKQLTLRIGYRSPEGWVTYSPAMALDFARQSRIAWRR